MQKPSSQEGNTSGKQFQSEVNIQPEEVDTTPPDMCRNKKERGEITATFERKRDAKAREKDNPEDEDYYIEFNMKQQRKFENCIIDNQSVIKPERLICLSNIRISDMRKFVYFRVLD